MKLFKWNIKKPELVLNRKGGLVKLVGLVVLFVLIASDNFWLKIPATVIILYVAFKIYRGGKIK